MVAQAAMLRFTRLLKPRNAKTDPVSQRNVGMEAVAHIDLVDLPDPWSPFLSGRKKVRYIHPAPVVYIHARNYVNRKMKYKVCLIVDETRGCEI
jgi:hypothetical protein